MLLKDKQEFVQGLAKEVKKTESMVLVYYQGLAVNSLTELRAQLKDVGCTMQVVKNRLAKKAIEESGESRFEQLNDFLEGPTALLLAEEDPSSAIKIFKKYVDENKLMEFRAAVIGENVYDASAVIKLSELPSREVLLAKVVMLFNSPIQGFYNALSAILKQPIYALKDLKEKMEKGEIGTVEMTDSKPAQESEQVKDDSPSEDSAAAAPAETVEPETKESDKEVNDSETNEPEAEEAKADVEDAAPEAIQQEATEEIKESEEEQNNTGEPEVQEEENGNSKE